MNKQSKKSVWLVLLCMIMVLCMALTLVACDNDQPDEDDSKGTLTFDVNAETTIGYYEYCTVPVIVASDDSGNSYFPKVEVKDSQGNVIALEDGKFFVTKETDYTFTYSLTWKGETVTKTTVAKVVDSTEPSITPTVSDVSAFVGDQVTVPSVALDDNRDSEEQITLSVKVVKGAQEIAVTDNKFTPTEAGVYNIVYTATDRAGNVATKTVSAYVIAKVDGEIAYFYENGSIQFSSLSNPWSSTLSYTTAGNYSLSADGRALSVSSTQSPSGVEINNPIVADISGYTYFYIDVYNPMDENVKFYINYIYNNNYIEIAPKVWTRVVAQKNSTGNFELLKVSGKISGSANDNKTIFGTDNVQATNIASLKLGLFDGANQTIYLGSFRAVNELPALPEDIVYAMAPKVTLASRNYTVQGSTEKVDFTITDGEGATLDVKVSINGAESVAVDNLDEFTFTEAGEYKFITVLTKDGKQIFKGESSVYCIVSAGNEVLFTGNQYGNLINGLTGWWDSTISFDSTAQIPGETTAGATKVTSAGTTPVDTSYVLGGLQIGTASIADVSGYKYIYFDVYNPQSRDIDFIVGYDYGYPVAKIFANHWTRIVLEVKEDGIYVRDAYSDQQGGNNKKACISNFNFSGVAIASPYINANEYFLISNVYAVNELPELPTGIKYNWNPVVEFDVDDVVIQDTTKTVGVTVTNNDDNLAYTLKVSVNGGEATAITAGDYKFETAGEYKFICEFTKDGTVVFTAEHSVYAVAATGNEVLFTGNQYGNQINKFVDWFGGTVSYDDSITVPGATSAGVLKLTAKEASPVGEGFYAQTASIANVSTYKCVYFDVYNAQSRDIDFVVGYAAGYPVVKLYANHWTRIVLEVKEDGVYLRDAYTDQNGGTNKKTSISNFNFTNVEFAAMGMNAGEYLYISNVYAVNDLPALPTGIRYDWTASVSFVWPENIKLEDSVNITATAVNADDAALSITVQKNGAAAVAVTNGSTYKFDVAGTYKFVAVLTLNGEEIARAETTITIVDTTIDTPDEPTSSTSPVLDFSDADVIEINGVTVLQNAKSAEYDSTVASPAETTGKGSLKIVSNGGELTGITVSTPSIADVRTYNYLYMDIYNPQSKDLDFSISYEYAYPLVKLRANSWTRIVIEVGREVGRYDVGADGKISNLYIIHAYSSQQGDLKQKISVYDGSFKNEEFIVFNLAADEYVYFGSLYAVNKLPALTDGVKYPVCARADFNVADFVVAGHKQVVTFSPVDVEGTLAVTLSVNGAEATTFTNGTEYTFATAGVYKFTATVASESTAVTTTKTVRVLQSNAGTKLIDLSSATAIADSNVASWQGATIAFDAEKDAMKLTATGGAVEGFNCAGFTANASIVDVRGYQFVYFDVYNAQDRDLELLIAYAWGYPLCKLKANSWTRVVITSGGHLLMLDATSSQHGEIKTKLGIDDGNFTGKELVIKGLASGESVYISSVYVTGELPKLPEGYVCGYKG